MERISKDLFAKVKQYINKNGRNLEFVILDYLFNDGKCKDVILELKKYQNFDGGFGNAIEPDFRLKKSSPMATAFAFKYLSLFDCEDSNIMVIKAIKYLESIYDKKNKRWFSVPKEVNDFPHAPWWEYKSDIGMTVIDYSWGNPTAELTGYLYKYREYVTKLDVDKLIEIAINKLNKKEEYNSEHEIYSYIHLYNMLDQNRAMKLEKPLIKAVNVLLNSNVDEWDNYVPSPIKFVCKDSISCFKIGKELINKNADFLIGKLKEDNYIDTSWKWDKDLNIWEDVRKEWQGVLTFEAMLIFNKLGRIDSNRKE